MVSRELCPTARAPIRLWCSDRGIVRTERSGRRASKGGRACPVGAGLKRYDFSHCRSADRRRPFDAGTAARDFRLPGLFCGFDREAAGRVVAYPVGCISQAWAAAASFLLLQAMLRVAARAPDGALAISKPVSAGLAIARGATPSASRRGVRKPRLRTGRRCHRILPARTGEADPGDHDRTSSPRRAGPRRQPTCPRPLRPDAWTSSAASAGSWCSRRRCGALSCLVAGYFLAGSK